MENSLLKIENYKSNYKNTLQKTINSEKGQLNEKELENHIKDIMDDPICIWRELVDKNKDTGFLDFGKLNLGDRIRYTVKTESGKKYFRTGGWIFVIDPSLKFLMYRGHTQASWSLQASECIRLFVTSKKNKEISQKNIITKISKNIQAKKDVIIFKNPGIETNFNAFLEKNGLIIRVGSFLDSWKLKKFMETNKFKKAKNGAEWEFEGESNIIFWKDISMRVTEYLKNEYPKFFTTAKTPKSPNFNDDLYLSILEILKNQKITDSTENETSKIIQYLTEINAVKTNEYVLPKLITNNLSLKELKKIKKNREKEMKKIKENLTNKGIKIPKKSEEYSFFLFVDDSWKNILIEKLTQNN